jgi:hypothetical protein
MKYPLMLFSILLFDFVVIVLKIWYANNAKNEVTLTGVLQRRVSSFLLYINQLLPVNNKNTIPPLNKSHNDIVFERTRPIPWPLD